MKFRVSNQSERLVGKLDAGDDLVDALTQVCEDHGVEAGAIRAVGHFDAIELVHFDSQKKRYETVVDGQGNFDLVSLDGNVSVMGGEVALRLSAVFSAAGPAGPQMVGGQLRRARAVDGEFLIESFTDLHLERQLDGASGRLILDTIERRAGAAEPVAKDEVQTSDASDDVESASGQSSLSWDQAIEEVEAVEDKRAERRSGRVTKSRAKKESSDPYQDLDLEAPLLDKGALLDHPKLGRCRVLDVEDDQYVRIRLPRGRIRKLALEVLDIDYQGQEDGKPLFEARVRR